ncbi:lysozyme inhibitor LprI family protein [Pigmentiphaga sp.]|jgi:Uncharacterized protein conserved in bacteria|uniref:lysozyme inhibitor LprI family protein n=1 Tax=Pigmentiphaga sp. TaxID=1977564 RepID=UPI0025D7E3E9|nr:lysozyme inhibitor LprI family protein [Pigmentiphaga sp.]MBX6317064.1 DUF1311 domain-containing protein [Pigmentiphaga sp.]
MRRWTLFALSMALAAPAGAQSDCSNQASQAGMNACAEQALKQSDAELNKTYRAILARLKDDKPLAQRLVSAQRAWIAYRDAECQFSSSLAEGGSSYSMVRAMCLAQQTRARTEALQAYLNCQEGDLSCPVPAP